MTNEDIISRFQCVVKNFANEKALTFKNKSYTYQELESITDTFSQTISNYLTPGAVVGILMEKSADYVISILAILKAGCTYLPLDSIYPIPRIQSILDDSGCKVLISDHDIHDLDVTVININANKGKTTEDLPKETLKRNVRVQYSYLIYTSGSTGKPKGIRITAEAILNLAKRMSEELKCFNGGKRIAMLSPFVFDVSVGQMYMSLLFGNEFVLVPDEVKYSLALLKDFFSENEIYCCDFTPTRLDLQVSYYEKLRCQHFYPYIIVCAGESLHTELAKRVMKSKGCKSRLYNYYGPTEICVYCAYHEISESDLNNESLNIPIGKALEGFQLYIFNEEMNPCKDYEIGELYIGGIGVSKEGYVNDVKLNETRFIDNPAYPYQRLYKSGDLAKRRSNGDIECLGRCDEQIKIHGYRVELSEIENAIERIPSVSRAKVILINDGDIDGLAAYYTKNEDIKVVEIDNALRKLLPYYMIPTYYIEVDAFSYNVNGKLDKSVLPDYHSGQKCVKESENKYDIDNSIGAKFMQYCAKVLNLTKVEYEDRFVSLGGDSLNAFELNALLELEWNVSLNIYELVGPYSLGRLAEILTTRIKENSDKKPLTNTCIFKCKVNSYQKVLLKEELKKEAKDDNDKNNLPLYNMVYMLELKQNVFIEKLQKAFNMVLLSHEMLRTHFVKSKNSFEICRDEYKEYTVHKEYIKDIASVDVSIYAKRFDVLLPELYQIILFEDENCKQAVLLNIHHLIVDYASIRIIVNELFSFYYNQDLDVPLYSECAFFSTKNSQPDKAGLNFWRKQLNNRPESVGFSGDINHDEVAENIDSFKFQIDKTDKMKDFCRDKGLTEYYLCFGALAFLLYCEKKKQEFIIGTYSMGRDCKGVPANYIGFFTDTIPLRLQIQGTLSVSMFLNMMKNKCVDILQYGGVDVGNLFQYMGFKDLCKGSLFDVAFNFIKEYKFELKEHNQKILLRDYSRNPHSISFLLTGLSKQNSIQFEINFEKNRYSLNNVCLLAGKYKFIIDSILRNPDCTIDRFVELYKKKYGETR